MSVALRRCPTPDRSGLGLLLTGLAVLLERGGPAAVAVERLADTLRVAIGARDEARAQASQALASATLLALLPFLFAVLVALADPDAARLYLHTWTGAFCGAAATVATAGSWWWIDRWISV